MKPKEPPVNLVLSIYSSLTPTELSFALAATFGGLILLTRVLLIIAGAADLGDIDHHEVGAHGGGDTFQISIFSVAVFFTIGGLSGLVALSDLGLGLPVALALSAVMATLMVYVTGVLTSTILKLAHPGAMVAPDLAVGCECSVCFRMAPKSCGLVAVELGGGFREFRAYNADDSDMLSGDKVLALHFDGQLLHVTSVAMPEVD